MARNKVMKLWTTIVTAFLALFTALGIFTTTASAAVPQTETQRNSENSKKSDSTGRVTAPTMPSRTSLRAEALPPTMKQRIHAEAHGKSPSCRHRPPSDASQATLSAALCDSGSSQEEEESPAPADTPLQR
ncbi:DUF6344 domain-containing protein [Streptomyces sp. NPDC052309]|uniref:DUF6344 domain-containing protein n=1 Tax=Streptomyces TaxID=1883 RepID=UPI001CB724D1|nr:DUF6344 domain-containing protein [Streptomyces griseicoloratus]